MMTAEATVDVEASPQAVLEFVMDIDQYRTVDPKIARLVSTEGPDEDGHGSIKIWARLKGLPPAPDRQDFTVERWTRLTFVGARRQPARMIFEFTGTIVCDPAGDLTRVTHAYEFRFKGPFRIAERLYSGWIQREIEKEMAAVAARFATSS